jgi:3-hydroxyacyl-CoA dehydrogenase
VKKNICIAGSGKIGRDAGMYFLKRGYAVTWVSGSEQRLVDLQTWVTASVHRFMKHAGGGVREMSASFALFCELDGETFDVVFECAQELLHVKKDVFGRLAGRYSESALLLTSSSSIVPSAIVENCMGLHVFFPLELTGIAELVVPLQIADERRTAAIMFCKDTEIEPIVQDETHAFGVNRLLLPLQNEVFCALAQGIAFADANDASVSPMCSIGMGDLTEKVGPAVMAAAVENYTAKMNVDEATMFTTLRVGLETFGATRGKWAAGRPLGNSERQRLTTKMYSLFINTCLKFVDQGEMSAADINRSLGSVFGASLTVEKALEKSGKDVIAETLREARLSGGAAYFEPAAILCGVK